MKVFNSVLALVAVASLAAPASAVVVDGSRVSGGDSYGAALAVQTVETSFGDNFSELDAGYAEISGGRLNLFIAGNIEGNFNKMEIWIDSRAGGENTLLGTPGNDGASAMNGLTFDTAFSPDFHLIVRRGNDFGNDKFDVDIAELGTANFDSYQDFLDLSGQTGHGTTGIGTVNGSTIEVFYDNSNVAGVLGGTAAADPVAAAAVTTGLEMSIALADLGYLGGSVRISALVNNGSHGFASNQVLGGLPAGSNHLAGLGSVNFSSIAGDQFFTVVPEPASLALLGLGGLMMLRRRRA